MAAGITDVTGVSSSTLAGEPRRSVVICTRDRDPGRTRLPYSCCMSKTSFPLAAAPKSNYAVTERRWYEGRAVELAGRLQPFSQARLEITAPNRMCLSCGEMEVRHLGPGAIGLDVATPDALHEASAFVVTMESREGLPACCPEATDYGAGVIDRAQLK